MADPYNKTDIPILNESGVSFDPPKGTQPPKEEPGTEENLAKEVKAGLAKSGITPKEPETELSRIRTYKSDVEKAVKSGASLVSITAAEQVRRQKTPRPLEEVPQQRRRILPILGIALLVLLGVSALGYGFMQFNNAAALPPTQTAPPLIFTNERTEISAESVRQDALRRELVSLKETAALSLGEILAVELTVPETQETIRAVTASEFLSLLEARAPTPLLRSLGDQFLLGIHTFDGNQPFLIFTSTFYENTFAGMLEWERTMSADLAPLFGDAITGTSPTSTPVFTDTVIENKDVRVLRRGDGEPALLYSFRDRNTLIITTNEHTLKEVFTRLETPRTLR